ncbi:MULTISPECIES: diguanylate cyclase [unclassified Shewanella]|uniref:sensor domain-containing diguanylate cyclase n=1 Tax=unclassified Shewanella TaxID=196818 RepID=UPI001BC5B2E3|nr:MULTISPECIES: diguanylate cyclase [unclassified Shewanella]GIU14028.1 deoxynucleoside kinase [Shewanella sp. MBTL60-112-B1]GIU28556.1 deoxynucleoside kinase [Shewanella sp. MBTL60-112-B2]
MKLYLLQLFLITLFLFSSLVSAGERLLITQRSADKIELQPQLYISQIDADTNIEQLVGSTVQWQQYQPKAMRGIGERAYWIKLSISYEANVSRQQILSIANPHLDNIELYHFSGPSLVKQLQAGDSFPFSQRPIISTHFLYAFNNQQQKNHDFYLRVSTSGTFNIPVTLWTSDAYYQNAERHSVFYGFQIGVLIAIGIFSLLIAVTSHSLSYSYYAGYVISITLFVASLHGLAFRFIWPNFPSMQEFALPALLSLSMMFAFLFSEKAMHLKYQSQTMLRLCRVSAAMSALLFFIGLLLNYSTALTINIYSVMLSSIILMCMSLSLAFKGNKLAKLFAIGWVGMMLGALISGAIYLGFLRWDLQAKTPFMIGLSIEVALMAALLAIRYNDERLTKLKIQKDALIQAKKAQEAKEEALRIEARSSEQLSQMVQERTLELEIALRELNEANQKLTEQARVDSLTGVKNRASFDKRIVAEGRISRRQQTPLSILMLDIDRFKLINDSYGHLAGDQALRVIADKLKETLKRPTDLVSRFGGEEFAIILPNTDKIGAYQVAETVRKALSELPINWGEDRIPLTVSIGVSSEIITSEEHTTLLLEQADKALYQAKNDGRNRVRLYNPDQN